MDAYLTLDELMPREDVRREAFNFSSRDPLTVVEVVERVLSLCDRKDSEPTILNEASCEIPKQTLDCAKAREVLNWSPRFSPDAALRETIHWYRRQAA